MLFICRHFLEPKSRNRIVSLKLSSHFYHQNFSTGRNPAATMSTVASQTSVVGSTPRLSASLVVVNGQNEVLLVHRNPNATSFGGMHVFPGGIWDQKQDESLEMTAVRETFEESGLLLASNSGCGPSNPSTHLSESALDQARHAIHQRKLPFSSFLDAHSLCADVDLLLPFTRWVTPILSPRRFNTQFFLTFLPSNADPSSWQSQLPMHDGMQEITEARFLHPRRALDECLEGKIRCMPPQFYILSTLADLLHGSVNTAEQKAKIETLSKGAFGQMLINPERLGRDEDGHSIVTFEGDETRGSKKGRLHRMIISVDTAIPAGIALMRNFDIFTEIEFMFESKL